MSALYEAVTKGDLDLVKAAIENGADVNHEGYEHFREAVKTNNQELVSFLLPYCNPVRAFGCIETAISNGLFEMADWLVLSGHFRYPQGWATESEYAGHMKFPARKGEEVYRHWRDYLVSRDGSAPLELLDPLYRGYALLYAATNRQGHSLVRLLVTGTDLRETLNRRVRVEEEFETPLTAAAESGNLTIIQGLSAFPETDVAACGKYGWPAFIHLLGNESCADSRMKRAVIERLAEQTPLGLTMERWRKEADTVCANAMKLGDPELTFKVIRFVWRVSGARIMPILIHGKQVEFFRWYLRNGHFPRDTPKPSPVLWLPLCRDIAIRGDRSNAYKFIAGETSQTIWERMEAEDALKAALTFWVEIGIYDPGMLLCLQLKHILFLEQFFYGPFDDCSVHSEIPPLEVARKAVRFFGPATRYFDILRPWVQGEYDASAFWTVYHEDYYWLVPQLEKMLRHPAVNPNKVDPHAACEGRPAFPDIPHAYFKEDELEMQEGIDGPDRLPGDSDLEQPPYDQRIELRTVVLEQNERRRLRDRQCPLTWAVATDDVKLVEILLTSAIIEVNWQDKRWRTPLMFAVMISSQEIVKVLIEYEHILINAQDDKGRSAIFYAAKSGDEEIVRLLLETGKVDLDLTDGRGSRVKDVAMDEGHENLVPLLWTA
ncbi:hypothetical protein N7493_010078 [Penicillium malachiteum]|uniref:Uncharacterized protein n=1 Tax=Penicillium malachiteum TaxID=1324776 RepID=A0AAD6HE39_9EURO|nr:hypothetical protein N7493_010078 [Penicillium malachiteum]